MMVCDIPKAEYTQVLCILEQKLIFIDILLILRNILDNAEYF